MSYAFRFLDDIAIADIAFEAEGDSAEELFVGATRALLEVLTPKLNAMRKVSCSYIARERRVPLGRQARSWHLSFDRPDSR